MITIKVLGYEFIYKGDIQLTISPIFVHISAIGSNSNSDYNVDDTFLANEVESIKGLDND